MDKYVSLQSKAIDSELCSELINKFNTNQTDIRFGPNNPYTNKKKIHYYEYIALNPLKSSFYDALIKHLKEYKNTHNFLSIAGSWRLSTPCLMQRYKPGMHYSGEHCEHGTTNNMSMRILAWMFYLNTIQDGGGTFFPQQNLMLKPKQGDLYIWPAGWTHSHYGIPANHEVKYILTGWCELFNNNKNAF